MVAWHGQAFEDINGPTVVEWDARHTRPASRGARALCFALMSEAWLSATQRIPPLPPGHHRKAVRQQYRRLRAQQVEARRWFGSDDTPPFSFRYLCSALNLDVGKVRRALAAALDRRTPSLVALTGT
jgi:hypothetical protein